MKPYLSHTLLNAVQRLADAPEQTLSKVAASFGTALKAEPISSPTPDDVMLRLESVFDALSELPFSRDLTTALDLACDTLQAELPSEAVAAGLYDIDADEISIVAARGMEYDLVRGTLMSRARCFAGRTADAPFVISGGPDGADWLGSGDEGTQVLLCPIMRDAQLLGVLAVADPLCAASFATHDLEMVSYVAGQLANFIQSLRQRPSVPPGTLAGRA